ncbi:hypothetical protein FXO37_07646 [Capsicum annuum]|nr:hypothetical protein FXO37_07646 [Capsicum annuum]
MKLESAKGSVKLVDKTKLEIVGKGTMAIEAPKGGSFTVTRDVNVEQLGRETKITLFFKEDQLEYLEERRIKDLIKKNSEFISYPIYLWAEKTTEKEISNDEDDEPKKDNEGSRKSTFKKTDVPHDEQLTTTEMGRRIKLLQKLHRKLVIGEVIHQIFAEKPVVCQAYLNFVPGKMSKKEFWTKYSRVEYFHSTKNIVATFAEASEDEELAFF